MPVLLLSEDDIRRLLTMDDALELVETGLRKLALEEAENLPRTRCRTDHVVLNVMAASAKSLGYLGYKAYTATKAELRFHFSLFDGRTGELLAVMRAEYLSQVRTGAASGVATKYLARADATIAGVIGSGRQARTQLLAICRVRPLKSVKVYSRSKGNRERFAQEMSRESGVEVMPVEQAELAVRESDVVVTATDSPQPVLMGDWLRDGCHVNAIGANYISKTEIDAATVRRASLVTVDSKEQALREAGDLVSAVNEGVLRWADIPELGDVIVGRSRIRTSDKEVTLFKSLGIAIEDIAVGAHIYQLAKARGIGREVEW